jgi:hypothetical protein
MRCILSDQFEFIALIMFSMVIICGVFQVLFLEYCDCFSVAFFLLRVTCLKTETGPTSKR